MSEEEPEVIEEIPYLVPVGPSTVKTVHGSYVRTWRMSGVPWLTATDPEKNSAHVELRKVLDSLTTENVVYSVHLVRGEIPVPQSAVFPEGSFAAELAGAYRQSLSERRVYVNALYLSVEYLPRGRKAKRLFSFRGKGAKEEAENKDANAVFDAISLSLEHNLARYSPTPLSIYRLADRTFSQQLEFYAFLINGDRRRVPLTNGNLQETMLTSRTLFAGETGELRSRRQSRSSRSE
jgi:type IV secretion system protein VirB4